MTSRVFGAIEKPGGIHGASIKGGKIHLHPLFHGGVLLGTFHRLNGKQHMGTGAGRFPVLFFLMVSTEVDGKGHIFKCGGHRFRGNPLSRILGMVVVAVHGQAVTDQEIFHASPVVCKFRADVIPAHRLNQRFLIGHLDFIWVVTVGVLAADIGGKQGHG